MTQCAFTKTISADVMELADVTDSKSVGSNTVRVRPPPSAPSNKPTLFMRGLIAFVPMAGGRTRNLRVAQGCAMAVTQSRYARMHKDSHTKPLHDATAQMAVDAQMHRPQRPQTQGCVIVLAQSFARMRNQQSKHDSTTPPRHTSTHSTSGVIIFGAAGGRTRTVRVRHGRLIK